MDEFKESVKNIITKQDVKVGEKTKKQLHPLSPKAKNISSKQSESDKIFSGCLEKISNNNKISTKFEISRTETEAWLKIKFGEYKYKTSISIYMKLLALN